MNTYEEKVTISCSSTKFNKNELIDLFVNLNSNDADHDINFDGSNAISKFKCPICKLFHSVGEMLEAFSNKEINEIIEKIKKQTFEKNKIFQQESAKKPSNLYQTQLNKTEEKANSNLSKMLPILSINSPEIKVKKRKGTLIASKSVIAFNKKTHFHCTSVYKTKAEIIDILQSILFK